ncbi:MAG TPA: type II secretion system F family protein [Rhizomicrobium sp.]|jgi:general secretion pathway protein F|nr:type II secretion system F family protein [Rhizomicrobium sp.]HEX4533830.1 type II secretion system F family protein [Rhizomicrobium sp.]
MAQYQYKAMTGSGAVVKGVLDATSKEAVIGQLRSQGLFPLDALEQGAGGLLSKLRNIRIGGKPSLKSLAMVTQELSTLLRAGLELDRALGILVGLSDIGNLKAPFEAVRNRVRDGASFADALSADPFFPKFYVSMVRAGEHGGALDGTLQRLTDYLTRTLAIRETITSALVYPAILLVTAGMSIVVILVFVLPEFEPLFADAGKSLPVSTQIVMAAGDFVRDYGWLFLILLVAGFFGFREAIKKPEYRLKWDALVLRIPVLGDLFRAIEVERLMRTFGTLLSNGVPVPAALNLSKDVLSNTVLAAAVKDAAASLREGERLAQRLGRSKVFPAITLDLIQIGEESGKLDEMLLRQADLDELRIKHRVDRALALLVPCLTIGLGAIVAGLISSMLVAILSINDLALQ